MSQLAEKIKFFREREKLSQDDLAKKLNVSRVTVTRYENGTREPNMDTLKKIAEVLSISTYELLDDEPYNLKVNRDIYTTMSDEELSSLLEKYNFRGDVFKEFSPEEKEKFKENLKEISPIMLKTQKYLDNFDNATKEDFIKLCNDIILYEREILKSFIDETYTPLFEHSKWQEKVISDLQEMLDKSTEIINLQKETINNAINSIKNNKTIDNK